MYVFKVLERRKPTGLKKYPNNGWKHLKHSRIFKLKILTIYACSVTSILLTSLWLYGLKPARLLSALDSPGILEWIAMPSSRGSSRPRDQSSISCLTRRFFTTEPQGKAHKLWWTLNWVNPKESMLICIIVNLLKTKDKVKQTNKQKNLKKMSQRKTVRNTASFLKQWMSKKKWYKKFQVV